MRYLAFAAILGVTSLSGLACHHTGQGIKADVKRDVQKTGQGIEHVGEKIENKGK